LLALRGLKEQPSRCPLCVRPRVTVVAVNHH
jgi:hypothetical protein